MVPNHSNNSHIGITIVCPFWFVVQEKTEDLSMYLKLLSFLDTSALIVAAAAANDASTVRDFLSRKPQEVGA